MNKAVRTGDLQALEAIFADDLIVHAPINRVVDRENVLARYRLGQISYEPEIDATIDFVGVRGETVVIMAEERLRPTGDAPHAGKLVTRRSTEVWKVVDGAWRLGIRQATITGVE
jgi:ketosteroid isomerase-like protein